MMKKKKLLALLMAMSMVIALAACSSGGDGGADSSGSPSQSDAGGEEPSDSQEPSDEGGSEEGGSAGGADLSGSKVAVFYYAYSDTYISSVRAALDAELDALGVNYQDFDGNNNQATQNETITTALADGFNILLVNLVTSGSPDAANAIIEQANGSGAKVIFFNRAIEADGSEGTVLNANDNICFIGTDAPEAGHLQGQMIGQYLLDHYDEVDLNGDGVISYAMMKGDEANVEAIYRTQYSVEDANAVLTAAGKPELVYFDESNNSKYQVDMAGQWSNTAALEYMNTNLAQYNQSNNNMIELVICNNDNMAEGVISALQSAGFNNGGDTINIPVFGVDATAAAQSLIGQGVMVGTVKQDAEGMAKGIAAMVEQVGSGATMADGLATVAASDSSLYTIDPDISNKMYVAYSAYTG